jgi:hypothetical protein
MVFHFYFISPLRGIWPSLSLSFSLFFSHIWIIDQVKQGSIFATREVKLHFIQEKNLHWFFIPTLSGPYVDNNLLFLIFSLCFSLIWRIYHVPCMLFLKLSYCCRKWRNLLWFFISTLSHPYVEHNLLFACYFLSFSLTFE